MFPNLKNSIKNNNSTNSNYTQHILEMNHMHRTIENITCILQIIGKGKHMNTLKKFHICNFNKQNQHLNDNTITRNLILIYLSHKTNKQNTNVEELPLNRWHSPVPTPHHQAVSYKKIGSVTQQITHHSKNQECKYQECQRETNMNSIKTGIIKTTRQ
jgi:hypothetical protein